MGYSKEKLIERAESALKEIRDEIKMAESYIFWKKKDAFKERRHSEHEIERFREDLQEIGYSEDEVNERVNNLDIYLTGDLYSEYFKDIDEAEADLKQLRLDREIYKYFLKHIKEDKE